MTFENIVYSLVLAVWLFGASQAFLDFWGGVKFFRYVAWAVTNARNPRPDPAAAPYRPKVSVIMPCCGVDQKLRQTVQALANQDYADYEVVFTFESANDPAYAAIGDWTAPWRDLAAKRIVAGMAERRSQKVHNLLAAVGQAASDAEVLVFLDSDAIPGPDWLSHLVAPLADERVGATTGYRWYQASGGLVSGLRCAWNAATVTLLHDQRRNFCWGGATAIRKATFDTVGVAHYWDGALSDDYQLTRAVRSAGLDICFVPQAMVISSDQTTMRAFWSFARRQMLITRICAPQIWKAGLMLTCSYVSAGTAALVLLVTVSLGWFGDRAAVVPALIGWLALLGVAAGKALVRQLALRKVLRPPAVTWRDLYWDVSGTINFAGLLYTALFLASLTSRRLTWRGIEYELISPGVTRVLGRPRARGE